MTPKEAMFPRFGLRLPVMHAQRIRANICSEVSEPFTSTVNLRPYGDPFGKTLVQFRRSAFFSPTPASVAVEGAYFLRLPVRWCLFVQCTTPSALTLTMLLF